MYSKNGLGWRSYLLPYDFDNYTKKGFYTPLYIKRSSLQLPGINDCTNRFAILIVLEYKSIQLLVNKGTLDFIKNYDLEYK